MISVSHFQGQGTQRTEQPTQQCALWRNYSQAQLLPCSLAEPSKSQVLLCVGFFFCLPLNKYFFPSVGAEERSLSPWESAWFLFMVILYPKSGSRMAWNILVTAPLSKCPDIHLLSCHPQISCSSFSQVLQSWFLSSGKRVHSSSSSLSSYLSGSGSVDWSGFHPIWHRVPQQDRQRVWGHSSLGKLLYKPDLIHLSCCLARGPISSQLAHRLFPGSLVNEELPNMFHSVEASVLQDSQWEQYQNLGVAEAVSHPRQEHRERIGIQPKESGSWWTRLYYHLFLNNHPQKHKR